MINEIQISLNDKVTQSPGFVSSNMNGEIVMLSIASGKYYGLGEIGGAIWGLLEEPIKVNQLITSLTKDYDVNYDECMSQVIAFLEQLLQEKLIQVLEVVN